MSTQIKKVYAELFSFLEANQDAKIKTLMPQIIEMVGSKQMSQTYKTDAQGNVTHVFCYYHKKWEDVSKVEYGSKAGAKTKLNSMCKEGVNQWTKQQRDLKKAKADILVNVANGKLNPDQIQAELIKAEEDSKKIVPREDGHGFDELNDE